MSGMHVAVLMGGVSSEREISLTSGRAASDALKRLGYRVTDVDVGWDVAGVLRELAPDVAFIALHGRYGEDGTIQGLLHMLRIPYTGSGVLASAAAGDKLMTKRLLRAAGVPTPDFEEVRPETTAVAVPYPLVVKPNLGGSSIGIRRVKCAVGLGDALTEAFAEDTRVYVEREVAGREVTVSVLHGEALPVVEIVSPSGIFSFEAKYQDAGTRYIAPAELPADVAGAATHAAVETYRAVGCTGAARVDLMLDDQLQPWVLEINTIPGLTRKSLLPMAAGAVGIGFDQLIGRMLEQTVAP